eukprot:CAMPEP_0203812320 /NCGR_PEP_ID=MMETSP0115-20131106/4082_1 /ASSEMBLY_ACC=CAM_ASM_000227 /TAXON_ID=33651 /ORGANISM="Bicosoecid sp, Strain ms1" /LENGTH=939 /DNA_ID=CAMNT_0050721163 /DNA_START=87 /DNA_END=2905 /DNA_ORIENTATION=+
MSAWRSGSGSAGSRFRSSSKAPSVPRRPFAPQGPALPDGSYYSGGRGGREGGYQGGGSGGREVSMSEFDRRRTAPAPASGAYHHGYGSYGGGAGASRVDGGGAGAGSGASSSRHGGYSNGASHHRDDGGRRMGDRERQRQREKDKEKARERERDAGSGRGPPALERRSAAALSGGASAIAAANSGSAPRAEPTHIQRPLRVVYGPQRPPSTTPPLRPPPPPPRAAEAGQQPSGIVLSGFDNLGNSCYLNATVQGLLALKPLRVWLVRHHQSCNRPGCMACIMFDVGSSAVRSGRYGSAVNPRRLYDAVIAASGTLRRFSQEDAHECLVTILHQLDIAGRPSRADGGHHGIVVPAEATLASSMLAVFRGAMCSRVTCASCRRHSDRLEPFEHVSLELTERTNSVDDALREHCTTERLAGDNAYECDRCRRKTVATKQLLFGRLPDALILHLKRFRYGRFGADKVTKAIDYGGTLRIPDALLADGVEGAASGASTYTLVAVVTHTGYSPRTGHYVCTTKRHPGSEWYTKDDDSVFLAGPGHHITNAAYILFYQRDPLGGEPHAASSHSHGASAAPASEAASGAREPRTGDARADGENGDGAGAGAGAGGAPSRPWVPTAREEAASSPRRPLARPGAGGWHSVPASVSTGDASWHQAVDDSVGAGAGAGAGGGVGERASVTEHASPAVPARTSDEPPSPAHATVSSIDTNGGGGTSHDVDVNGSAGATGVGDAPAPLASVEGFVFGSPTRSGASHDATTGSATGSHDAPRAGTTERVSAPPVAEASMDARVDAGASDGADSVTIEAAAGAGAGAGRDAGPGAVDYGAKAGDGARAASGGAAAAPPLSDCHEGPAVKFPACVCTSRREARWCSGRRRARATWRQQRKRQRDRGEARQRRQSCARRCVVLVQGRRADAARGRVDVGAEARPVYRMTARRVHIVA